MEQHSLFNSKRDSSFVFSSDRIILAIMLFITFLFIIIWDKIHYYGGFEYIPIGSFISVFIYSMGIILIAMFYLVINWKKEKYLLFLIGFGIILIFISIFLPFGIIEGINIGSATSQLTAFTNPLIFILLQGEILLGLAALFKLVKSIYKEDYNLSSLFVAISFLEGSFAFSLIFLFSHFQAITFELGFYVMVLGTITMFIAFNSIDGDNYPSKHLVESK